MSWLFAPQLRPFVALAALASLLLNVAMLMPAVYMLQVFDRVFSSRSVETLAMLTLMVTVALAFGWFMDALRTKALASAGRLLDARLSPEVLRQLLDQAALPERRIDIDAMKDVTQLRSFLGSGAVLALFDAPWLPIYVLAIGVMHPALGFGACIAAALLVALAVVTERLSRSDAQSAKQTSRAAQQHALSLMRNGEVIAGMGMRTAATRAWQQQFDEMLSAQGRLSESNAKLGATARMLRQFLQAALLGLGAWLVIGVEASPGIMVAATVLLGRALQPVEQLIAGWKALVDAREAWSRLGKRLTADQEFPPLALPAPEGSVDIDQVVYGATGARSALLRGVTLRLQPGQSLGLVGPSASGKTTLVRLVLGLWRPQSGTVRLDGADISRWDREALGPYIGYLPQDVELFAGTVAENIARLGTGCSAEEVVQAARLAHAHEMILRLPKGYDTPIGESGCQLSGGQRQRIALARALFGSPRFVVLDEPNANLDAEGEAALLQALQELKARRVTVLIVSHKTALPSHLDRVAVLRDGVIVAQGRPTEGTPGELTPGLRAVS